MQIFEIHITGNKSILETPVKTIAVQLLKPDNSYLRTEYMTSQVIKKENFEECQKYVNDLVNTIQNKYSKVSRVKIESPFYEEYQQVSKYMETHFESNEFKLPTSKNQKKETLLATDREYNWCYYKEFMEKYKGKELELCLYDSYPEEDFDWQSLYKGK